MASHKYRFQRRGVTPEELTAQVAIDINATCGNLLPPAFQDIECDDSFYTDFVNYMAAHGWTLSETDPPPNANPAMIAQLKSAVLGVDSSSIPVASGWTDVAGLAVSVSTKGNSVFGIVLSCASAAIAVGAEVRVLINGGSFSDTLIGQLPFPLLVGGSAPFTTTKTIPGTGSRTTYTVRVQARGVGLLASVSLKALVSSLTVFEYIS